MAPDTLVSVVMAAETTEAFINELGDYFALHLLGDVDTVAAACGDARAEVERSRDILGVAALA